MAQDERCARAWPNTKKAQPERTHEHCIRAWHNTSVTLNLRHCSCPRCGIRFRPRNKQDTSRRGKLRGPFPPQRLPTPQSPSLLTSPIILTDVKSTATRESLGAFASDGLLTIIGHVKNHLCRPLGTCFFLAGTCLSHITIYHHISPYINDIPPYIEMYRDISPQTTIYSLRRHPRRPWPRVDPRFPAHPRAAAAPAGRHLQRLALAGSLPTARKAPGS